MVLSSCFRFFLKKVFWLFSQSSFKLATDVLFSQSIRQPTFVGFFLGWVGVFSVPFCFQPVFVVSSWLAGGVFVLVVVDFSWRGEVGQIGARTAMVSQLLGTSVLSIVVFGTSLKHIATIPVCF